MNGLAISQNNNYQFYCGGTEILIYVFALE
jgi:hypothetical protein